jgi:transposase
MISLSDEERAEVEGFLRRGTVKARVNTRARILLKSAEGWSLQQCVETFGVSQATVSNVRQRYRVEGIAGVLKDRQQTQRRQALDGTGEAVLVALACSPVPEGHDHWTLRMLRDKLIELEVVEGISAATVQDRLKKMNLSPGSMNRGASPRK